ncbi:hypothetical protein L3i22_062540 [Actinoplanes sp. L3-i22]|nr:hypothetical protein L3i22_062540 [Actinoplanes sp. L3-i22]
MSQPQPAPWGGATPDPAAPAAFPYPGAPAQPAYPGAPVQAAYPGAPAQPAAYPGAPGQPAGYPGAPGQPGAFPAPYAGQPGQAPYPGQPGQAGYPQGQPVYAPEGVLPCRFCGSIPAAHVKFRGHQGMFVFMRFLSNEGPFCRDCGLGVFRHMTSRTLVQGWYGYGSFIITPITVLMNLIRRGKIANLPAPQPNPYGTSHPPADPGPRLLERPLTWLGLVIPFALIALIVYAATH